MPAWLSYYWQTRVWLFLSAVCGHVADFFLRRSKAYNARAAALVELIGKDQS